MTFSSVTPNAVRVATWNLLHNHTNYRERLEGAARVLADCDIVLLQEVARGEGYDAAWDLAELLDYDVASEGHTSYAASWGHHNGTAILTRLPVLSTVRIPLEGGVVEEAAATWLMSRYGTPILVVTAHLEWGAEKEHVRLSQVRQIDHVVEAMLANRPESDREPIVIFGGDFNTEYESDSIRYLTGKSAVAGESAFWTDVWEINRDSGNPGYTSMPAKNTLAAEVATNRGLNPFYIPARRIDYILVRGWVWGRIGCPMNADIRPALTSRGAAVSDHELLVADLWDPAPRSEPTF